MCSELSKTPNATQDMILDILYDSDCSNRLLKAITKNRNHLPVTTVQSYMENPNVLRQEFLKLPGIGKFSAMELDYIIRKFKPDCAEIPKTLSGEEQDYRNAYATALSAIEMFCSGVQYPDDLLDFIPPGKLANTIRTERNISSVSFFQFLKTYDQTVKYLRFGKNCSSGFITQLDDAVSRTLRTQLKSCGADIDIVSDLQCFMRDDTLSPSALARLAELGNWKDRDETPAIPELISIVMAGLSQKHREFLQRRYGIEKNKAETLGEISHDYEISRERVRQILNMIKKKLATPKVKTQLSEVLDRSDLPARFFRRHKIISREEMKKIAKSFLPEERLALDIVYGNLESFLDAHSRRIKEGWLREQDISLLDHMPENVSGSLIKRIKSALSTQKLPLRLSAITSALPDYSIEIIKRTLSDNMKVSVDGDILHAPRMPIVLMCIIILRTAGTALHFTEVKTEIWNIFKRDVSNEAIKSILSLRPEFFIVQRGTYNIFDNIGLEQDDLEEIRNRTFAHLQSIGGFISVKTLFSRLFAKDKSRFGNNFEYYMFLGILKGDKRFKTRPGLMVGTAHASGYKSLTEEVMEVLANSEQLMSTAEIATQLGDRRNVQQISLLNLLKNHPDIVPSMWNDKPGRPYYRFALATRNAEKNQGHAGNETS